MSGNKDRNCLCLQLLLQLSSACCVQSCSARRESTFLEDKLPAAMARFAVLLKRKVCSRCRQRRHWRVCSEAWQLLRFITLFVRYNECNGETNPSNACNYPDNLGRPGQSFLHPAVLGFIAISFPIMLFASKVRYK